MRFYISDGSAIFLPSGAGDATPAFYLLNGVKRQLILTALNARARDMVKFERLLRFSCTIRTHWDIFSVVAMWWSLFTATITGS